MRLIVYSDGSTANEGAGKRYSFIGVSIRTDDGQEIESISEYIGSFNSNLTEYMAAEAGVRRALLLGATEVEVRSDSLNLVNVFNGSQLHKKQAHVYYAVINKMKDAARSLASFSVIHVDRNANRRANQLSHQAYKRAPINIQSEMERAYNALSGLTRIDTTFVPPTTMEEAERRRDDLVTRVKAIQETIRLTREAFRQNALRREAYGPKRNLHVAEWRRATRELRSTNEWIRKERSKRRELQTCPSIHEIPSYTLEDASSLIRAALFLFRRLAREGLVEYTHKEQVLVDALREYDCHYGSAITKVS